jgi:hypothetical protein
VRACFCGVRARAAGRESRDDDEVSSEMYSAVVEEPELAATFAYG